MKTLITITEAQRQLLADICKKKGISRAEAIRQAIEEYGQKIRATIEAPDVFGMWKSKPVDALKYEDKLRNEWDPKK